MSRLPGKHWYLAAALGLSACQMPVAPGQKPVNTFRADDADVDGVRRVMVLPVVAEAGITAPLDQLRSVVVDELTKLQMFEVVPLPDNTDEDEAVYAALRRGQLAIDALVALGRRYRLDGVVLGTITSYRAYPPAHLGMRLQMLSLHSGARVWAAEGQYDAAETATLDDMQNYARSYLAAEASMHGWEINLVAPTRFAGFVAHRLVATWRE